MRAALYARVSTDQQKDDGTSLSTQEQACREFAATRGWDIVFAVQESKSGFTLDRPGLAEIRKLASLGQIDIVLTYALDRLSRKQTHVAILVEEMEAAGVTLDFVTESFEDTATGQLLRSVKAFAAEFEREKIAERTMRGKTQRAKAGKIPQATGRGIYGYRYDQATGGRHIEPGQAAVVVDVFERFARGESCNGLASSLNKAGLKAFSGGQWYPLTIRRMLLNETYTGHTIFRRTRTDRNRDAKTGKTRRVVSLRAETEWIEIEGATPPIVPAELFNAVLAILSNPERRNRARPSRHYPLTGRMRCGVCGAPMVGQVLMKGRYAYYRCRSRYVGRSDSSCPSKYIRCDSLETAVRNAIVDVLSDPKRVLSEAKRLTTESSTNQELALVTQALKDIEAKQRRLVRLFTEGDLPENLLAAQRRELSGRQIALEEKRRSLEAHAQPTVDFERLARELPDFVQRVRAWLTSDEADLSLLLNAVDAHVRASGTGVQIEGTLPIYEASVGSDLATIEQTSA